MQKNGPSREARRLCDRRALLKLIATSPLYAAVPGRALLQDATSGLKDPADALSVLDFEEAAKQAIPPAHWGYLATGVDGDRTLRANREGFDPIQLRPRRLVNVAGSQPATTVLDEEWELPLFLCPCGSQNAYHPEGELGTARGARSQKVRMALSTVTSTALEDVAEAHGEPPWYQLYAPPGWDANAQLLRRVAAAGCRVLVLTIDVSVGRHVETQRLFERSDRRDCDRCHRDGTSPSGKPMYDGLQLTRREPGAPTLDWTFVDRLRDATQMKLVIKGIETREDAELCVEHGADALVVSNHGGRATETNRSTIECLPEVVAGVDGRIPVLIDGGFRRGTDIFKALALGADAVGIGRPYLWGLGAFGQAGVERVIELLRAELRLVMRQCGVRSIDEIDASYVTRRGF